MKAILKSIKWLAWPSWHEENLFTEQFIYKTMQLHQKTAVIQ